jgi:hypothetical protein
MPCTRRLLPVHSLSADDHEIPEGVEAESWRVFCVEQKVTGLDVAD